MYSDGSRMNELMAKVEENNVMLHRMQRARRLGSFMWMIKWLVIIAFAAGAYYYLQPIVESFRNVWPGLAGFVANIQALMSAVK